MAPPVSPNVPESKRLLNHLVRSLLRLLEGRPQGGKALIFSHLLVLSHDALTIMDAVSSNSVYLSINTLLNNKYHTNSRTYRIDLLSLSIAECQ
jgi:hypothetical protein